MRVYGPFAAELAAGLVESRPDLREFPVAVARWAQWEARSQLMRRHLAEIGDIDEETGEVRTSPTHWLFTCERAAERAAALLGLDPVSDARLAKERASAALVSVDLEQITARGRAVLAEREAQGVEQPDLAEKHLGALRKRHDKLWREQAEQKNGRPYAELVAGRGKFQDLTVEQVQEVINDDESDGNDDDEN